MKRILTAAFCALIVLVPGIAQAHLSTEEAQEFVTSLHIDGEGSSLVLEFDEPISSSMVDDVKDDLVGDVAEAASAPIPEATHLACGDKYTRTDANGVMSFGVHCPSGTRDRSTPWGYRLSAAVQASVVGQVSEDGMWWWRSDVRQTKLAPHVVPPDYHFHGTFRPVYDGSKVQYQDLMTWRHNIGTGGTAKLTIAGEFHLV